MKNKANLRFFLALGNSKVVLLKEGEELNLYSSRNGKHSGRVNENRILEAAASTR